MFVRCIRSFYWAMKRISFGKAVLIGDSGWSLTTRHSNRRDQGDQT
jgi:hypothetical protein